MYAYKYNAYNISRNLQTVKLYYIKTHLLQHFVAPVFCMINLQMQ